MSSGASRTQHRTLTLALKMEAVTRSESSGAGQCSSLQPIRVEAPSFSKTEEHLERQQVLAANREKTMSNTSDQPYPQPPFPEQGQPVPGFTERMSPRPRSRRRELQGKRPPGRICGDHHRWRLGIGRAVAIAFAREGADILISYLNEDEDAAETARWIEQAGRKAILVPGDIQDEGHCKSNRRAGGSRVRQAGYAGQQCCAPEDRGKHRREYDPKNGTGLSGPTSTRCSTCARRPSGTCGRGAPS